MLLQWDWIPKPFAVAKNKTVNQGNVYTLMSLWSLPFSPTSDPHAAYIHQKKQHNAFVYIMLTVSMFYNNHETHVV